MNAKVFALPPRPEPLRPGEDPAKEPPGLMALLDVVIPEVENGQADKITALRVHPVQRQAMVDRLREAADLIEKTPEQVIGICMVGLYLQSRSVVLDDGPMTQYRPAAVRVISGAPCVTEFLSGLIKPEPPVEDPSCQY